MRNTNSFLEHNPNVIIELNKSDQSISYINLAARIKFPLIEKARLTHPILNNIFESLHTINNTRGHLGLLVREITINSAIYEQQIYTVPDEESIYVYMHDITYYRSIEQKSLKYLDEFEKSEQEYKLKLQHAKSELKNSLEMFKKRREQVDLALKSVSVATWNWNAPCDMMTWDEHMNELLDLKTTNYCGKIDTIFNAIHPQYRDRFVSDFKKSWFDNAAYSAQFQIIKRDGTTRELCLKSKPYSDAHGQLKGLAGVLFSLL